MIQAIFAVQAGVVPGQHQQEHTKTFAYQDTDFAADRALSPQETTQFARLRDEALGWAKNLIDPSQVNWVSLQFIWY